MKQYTIDVSSVRLTEEQIDTEMVRIETDINSENVVRVHINSVKDWFNTEIDTPEFGKEYLGYNKLWIDEDYNPDGICVCVPNDDGSWDVAVWCGDHDEWHILNSVEDTDKSSIAVSPTHWKYKPTPPKV